MYRQLQDYGRPGKQATFSCDLSRLTLVDKERIPIMSKLVAEYIPRCSVLRKVIHSILANSALLATS